MTSPQTLVPEIRFEGFSSAWERHRLSEFANFSRGNGLSWADVQSDGVNECILYGNLYTDYGMIAESVKYRTNLVPSNPAFSQYGDVLIPGSDTTPTGLARATSIEKTGVLLGGDINILRPNGNVNGSCLSLAINANKSELIKLIKGITVRHIHNDDIKDVEVAFPVAKDEQEKLVGVFKKIDYLINLHQRKQNHLKSVKKSMLEKMFPRDGANVPEIRFAGFTNAWEQRKVGDLLVERNEQAPMSDEYPLMAFIANEGVAPKGERYDRSSLVNDTVGKLYKKTEFGDFIYSSNNLETGSIGLNKYGNASISPVYSIFQPTGIADSDFIGRRFVRKDFINAMVKWRQGVIYGQWKIHESDFLKIEVAVPSVEEQRKIGAFLDDLDNLITLHQCKCDKLKEIKNSLLQKMFV